MGETERRTAGCLCGAVRYAVTGPIRDVFACHCHRCRRTSGNFVAASAAPTGAITFDADDTLRWYAPDDDPGVEYGFCERCGSSLFFRVVGSDSVSLMAGTFDDTAGLRTTEVWFADHAADHVTLDPVAVHHPGQPSVPDG